jgi:hypothetical protein
MPCLPLICPVKGRSQLHSLRGTTELASERAMWCTWTGTIVKVAGKLRRYREQRRGHEGAILRFCSKSLRYALLTSPWSR